MQLNKNLFLILLLSLSGCASNVDHHDMIYTPKVMHYLTPEAHGEMGLASVEAHLAGDTPTYILASASKPQGAASATIDTTQSLAADAYFDVLLRFGLVGNTDLFIYSDGTFGFKMQLLGTPYQIREKGFKLALSASLKDNNRRKSARTFYLDNSDDLESEVRINSVDAAINFGYRYNETSLTYVNLFTQKSRVKGQLFESYSSPNKVLLLTSEGTSNSDGLLIGYEHMLKNDNSVMFELGVVQTSWPTLGKDISFPFGMSISKHW